MPTSDASQSPPVWIHGTEEDPFGLSQLSGLPKSESPVLVQATRLEPASLRTLCETHRVRAIFFNSPEPDRLNRALTPDLLEDDAEEMRRDLQEIFIEGFFKALGEILTQANLPASGQQQDDLKRHLHRLAGGAGTCGFHEVGQLAKRLEMSLAQSLPEDLLANPAGLETAFCQAFMEGWLGPWP